jgi:hypothetical protein
METAARLRDSEFESLASSRSFRESEADSAARKAADAGEQLAKSKAELTRLQNYTKQLESGQRLRNIQVRRSAE